MSIPTSKKDFCYGVVCAFAVLYGRPFKQKPELRLDTALVPPEFADLHSRLIALRDKTFAHIDLDGPWPKEGYFNKSRITVKKKGYSAGLNYFSLTPAMEAAADELSEKLISGCKTQANGIWRRHQRGSQMKDGIYEVNIDPKDNSLLVPFKSPGNGIDP